ncbi:MAG: hypothetical protein J5819_07795 [Eubacterium sp.]|nr:hypothetical protein [Eubacterium sp.]
MDKDGGEDWMTATDTKAMSGTYKAKVAELGTPISAEQFEKLRQYANEHSIRLSGFKDFVGSIETIKMVIDDISEIAHDFPAILDESFLYNIKCRDQQGLD